MEVEEIPFTELLSEIVDNRGRTCPTAEAGLPLIATNCVHNDLLYPAFDKVRYVSQDTYENWFRGHPVPGDLIFVCKGTPGRVCMTPDPVSFCIAQDMVAVRADSKKVYPKYLFAVLRSSQIQAQIRNMHVGSLIPHFKKGDFDKLLLPVPDKKTQVAIGDTYFELSAKIELNQQMNVTLEATARALFQSWFVDFDPVRAKLDGRAPNGMNKKAAELFPSNFSDSEFGRIPNGWVINAFSDVFKTPLRNGLTRPKSVRGAGIRMVNMGELFANRRIGNIEMDRVLLEGEERERNLLETGDLLFARQSLTLAGAGQCSVVIEADEPRTFESHLIRCRLDRQKSSPWFFFYYFLSSQGRARIESIVEQVAAAGIRGSDLSRMKVLIPPIQLQRHFEDVVTAFESTIAANTDQSQTLATLRDTLLPKLLRGDLRVGTTNTKLKACA